jgi:hypothetical protein
MKTRAFVLALVLALYPALAISQAQPAASVLVKAGKLLDVRKGKYIENFGIWIEGERIKEVGRVSDPVCTLDLPCSSGESRNASRSSKSLFLVGATRLGTSVLFAQQRPAHSWRNIASINLIGRIVMENPNCRPPATAPALIDLLSNPA